MSQVALGFKPRVGRCVLVVLSAQRTLIERADIPLLPPGQWAPYHAAEGLSPQMADRKVRSDIKTARHMALDAVLGAVKRAEQGGHDVVGCGVLVGNGVPAWSTAEVMAVHVRMHQVEGELFREVLVAAANDSGLPLTTLPDKTALDAAARSIGIARKRFDEELVAIGKTVGAPWGRYQKEAAAAALVALQARSE